MKPIFINHRVHIISEINSAIHDIRVAVAWISDPLIINALAKKGRQGVNVEILVSAKMTDEKFRKNHDLTAKFLFMSDCAVFKIGSDLDYSSKMHHKFCVIDGETVITGSYNWTRTAPRNDEDIIIINDKNISQQYLDRFEQIKARISDSRLWFNKISIRWQGILKESIGINHEPTNSDLERIKGIEQLDVSSPPKAIRERYEQELFDMLIREEDNPDEDIEFLYRSIAREEFAAISDLSPVSNLTNIKRLDCSGSDINSLKAIAQLTTLEELDISMIEGNALDLTDLSKLTNLRVLWCAETELEGWEAISNLINLEELHFTSMAYTINNTITSLAPLKQLVKLKHLDINGLQVKDLSPLSNLRSLEVLYAEQSLIENLSPLYNLQNLSSLDLNGAPVRSDQLKELKKRNPNVEFIL